MLDLSNNFVINKKDEKRNRKTNAVKLPIEIDESMIPKYVVYYRECYNKEQQLYREFFKIEKHPNQTTKKVYTSSKSNKITIKEKLEQIKEMLNKIEEDILDEPIEDTEDKKLKDKKAISLPKYVSLKKSNNDKRYYFLYDKKILNLSRQTCKMICDENLSFSQNLQNFLIKIENRFNTNKENSEQLYSS